MVWFKVDDKLHSHRKARKAGPAAMGLWVLAGSWSADQMQDGFVPDYIASALDRDYRKHSSALVQAGLWVEASDGTDKGWRFHDWAEMQPTREDVEDKRHKERDKKRSQRRKPGGQFAASLGVSPGDTEGDSLGSPAVPTRPDPNHRKIESASADSQAEPAVQTAQVLISEWIEHQPKRPPGQVIGQVGKQLRAMLDEGIEYDDVRTGLIQWQAKGLHPSTLPSVVHEMRSARPHTTTPRRQQETDDLFARALRRNGVAADNIDQKAIGA